MFDSKYFDDISKQFTENLPDHLKTFKNDLEENIKNTLQLTIQKLDLVSRAEFDIQTQVLAKTREKLEALEKRVATLEGKVKQPESVCV